MTAASHAWRGRLPVRVSRASIFFLGLSLWGCWAIHNATRSGFGGGRLVTRQLAWIGVGAAALLACGNLSERVYRRLLPWLCAAAYAALLLVLAAGVRIHGMRGWFAWRGYFLQPGELAKPVYVLSLAWLLERTAPHQSSWRRGFLPALGLFCLWAVPIALQPDFGTLLVYALTFVVTYWGFGGRLRHLLAGAAAAVPTVGLLCWRYPYLLLRLRGFLSPQALNQTAGWHIIQFRRTLASGGLLGKAWEEGLWSSAYLPLGYSDSVFASTAEKIGFFGVMPLILLILSVVIYGHYHACRAANRFRAVAIFGLTAMLVTQAFVHLSVNLGLMPPTGITLPLVSYGGSSLLSSAIAFGIVEAMTQDAPAPRADAHPPRHDTPDEETAAAPPPVAP